MSDVLDQPQTSGPPAAYFPAVGDSIVVGIVDVGEYQQRDYDTGDLKTWPDGGKVMGKVVTGLVVSTTGGTGCGGEKTNAPVNAGDLVTFWCEGSKHFTYRDAVKAHGAVSVGDVMLWRRDDDKPPSNPRHNPAKQYVAKIRAPKPEDGDLVERCVAKRRELKAQQVDAPAAPSAPGPFSDDPEF
jgi:hypothetical protein